MAISKEHNEGVPKAKKTNLFSILKPYKGLIFLLLLCSLISNGLTLVLPKMIASAIDAFETGDLVLKKVAINFSIISVLIFIFTYGQTIVQTYTSEKVAKNLRNKLAAKISNQSATYIEETNPSKILTLLTSDIHSIKIFASQAVVSLASSIFIILGTCILLLTTNTKLALIVLLIIPLIGGTFFFILSRVRPFFLKSREIIDRLNKIINENIVGAGLVRVLDLNDEEFKKFLNANSEAKKIGLTIRDFFSALIPIVTFFASMATLAVLIIGGRYVILDKMSLGDFTAFLSYVAILIFPILVIGFISNVIAMASTSYSRIEKILNEEDKKLGGDIEKEIKGKIEFKNISLKYKEKAALKNVSFSLNPGTKTAIIGPTGAGKTQILYLLTGLISPTEGKVLYDDTALEEYKVESLYNQIGFVFQDSIIFNMSLRKNIAFGEGVDEESLQRAIKVSLLEDFINALPEGLETVVSERGSTLSGGQKQRIMLARALSLNPKVLLLDDFTARVDIKTEEQILKNILENYPGLTIVSVTQKISNIDHFDHILLMMEGELLTQGKHEELLKNSPEYVQIYNSQRSTNNYELQS